MSFAGVTAATMATGATMGGGAAAAGGMGMLGTGLALGTAGMGLASAFSSQSAGTAGKFKYSEKGKALNNSWTKASDEWMKKAKMGDVRDAAFEDVSKAKVSEDQRETGAQDQLNTTLATIGNAPKDVRGNSVAGGSIVKAGIENSTNRMNGLFAPTSILNGYRKENLVNAAKNLSNQHNAEGGIASFNYADTLSKYTNKNINNANKGAAIGSAFSTLGQFYSTNSYVDRMNKVSAANKIG